jgi:hypothetical protein
MCNDTYHQPYSSNPYPLPNDYLVHIVHHNQKQLE